MCWFSLTSLIYVRDLHDVNIGYSTMFISFGIVPTSYKYYKFIVVTVVNILTLQ